MIKKEHTRNQRRMYRIHKQDEKILAQELIVSSLQQENERLNNDYRILKELQNKVNEENNRLNNAIKALKYYSYNALDIIYNLKDNVEPTENKWLNLMCFEKFLKELKEENKC